uniref:Uncharacterized protein n=1 Tax=Rhizophora mucronata TaxID=61149 RepID=A0A2P2P379_RHIMU
MVKQGTPSPQRKKKNAKSPATSLQENILLEEIRFHNSNLRNKCGENEETKMNSLSKPQQV